MHYKIGKIFLAAACGLLTSTPRELHINTYSYHLKNNSRYNNFNLGLSYKSDKEVAKGAKIVAGAYNNSFRKLTVFEGVYKDLISKGNFSLGAAAGVATGYNDTVVPAATLTMSYYIGNFVINLNVAISAVMNLSLGFRF